MKADEWRLLMADNAMQCTGAEKETEEERLDNQPKLPWDGSDRDYSYQELLGT